jgi:hypothetical protein
MSKWMVFSPAESKNVSCDRINTTTHQCSMVDVPPVANVWEEFTTSKKNVDKSCAMI